MIKIESEITDIKFEEFIKTLSTSELVSLIMDCKAMNLMQAEIWRRTENILNVDPIPV